MFHLPVTPAGLRAAAPWHNMPPSFAQLRNKTCSAGLGALVPWLLFAGVGPRAIADEAGSTCCSDLESRIGDLEAGAARAASPRKALLTASGGLDQEVTYWNDGEAADVYQTGIASQVAHFKFGSDIKVTPELTVGFLLRIQFLTAYPFLRLKDTDGINQKSDERDFGADTHMIYWYASHKELGKITLGKQSNAAKSAAMLTDQSGTQRFDNPTMLTGFPQFIVRSNGDLVPKDLTWAEFSFCHSRNMPVGSDCGGISLPGVRFDMPSIFGLVLSASWGPDGLWEAAARYNREFDGLKLALGAAVSHTTDETQFGRPPYFEKTSDYYQAGGYLEHLETGLFVHAVAGFEDNHDTPLKNGKTTADGSHWGLKAGVRGNWNSLGATILYGDYTRYEDHLGTAALGVGFTSSTFDRFGGGIAQEFDQSSMTLYLKYQHYHLDADGIGTGSSISRFDDAQFISIGDLITF